MRLGRFVKPTEKYRVHRSIRCLWRNMTQCLCERGSGRSRDDFETSSVFFFRCRHAISSEVRFPWRSGPQIFKQGTRATVVTATDQSIRVIDTAHWLVYLKSSRPIKSKTSSPCLAMKREHVLLYQVFFLIFFIYFVTLVKTSGASQSNAFIIKLHSYFETRQLTRYHSSLIGREQLKFHSSPLRNCENERVTSHQIKNTSKPITWFDFQINRHINTLDTAK